MSGFFFVESSNDNLSRAFFGLPVSAAAPKHAAACGGKQACVAWRIARGAEAERALWAKQRGGARGITRSG